MSLVLFHRFWVQNHQKRGSNTSPEVPWWLGGAICLAMTAPGELFGAVEGSSGAKRGLKGAEQKV